MKQGTIKVSGLNQWMDLTGVKEPEGIRERCNKEYLTKYIQSHVKMRDVEVIAEITLKNC